MNLLLRAIRKIIRLCRDLWRSLLRPFLPLDESTYLFVATNGAGLGHLTRALAIARRLEVVDPEAKIVFYATSIAIPVVMRFGYVCYHVPPADSLKPMGVTPFQWNQLYALQFTKAIEFHRPGTVIFDGSYPYAGLRRVMRRYRRIKWVWVRRGMNRETATTKWLDSIVGQFDLALVPGELPGQRGGQLTTDRKRPGLGVPPIVLTRKSEMLSRENALADLRLDPGLKTAYVQLGAGNINEIHGVQAKVLSALKSIPGLQVVVGQSPISLAHQSPGPADRVITDYPNARYFAAFDVAVLAAGYNSVAEAFVLGLPAVFFPNLDTASDDQQARAEAAAELGPWRVMTEWSEREFIAAIDILLETPRPGEADAPDGPDGALEAASLIAGLTAQPGPLSSLSSSRTAP